jgi:hypothetical protein
MTRLDTTHNKRNGSVGECLVTAELLKRSWVVSTPEGDYAPYDRIATKGPFIQKIQVKSASHQNGSTFKWTLGSGRNKRKTHPLQDISFYIFTIVPANIFLVVPYDLIIGLKTLSLTTAKSTIEHSKYFRFVGSWGLLENKGYKDVI